MFPYKCRWCGLEYQYEWAVDICEEMCLSKLEGHVEAKQEIVIEVALDS